ncbi:MAG: heme utilization protein, partial [Betaproteobacteria bacterium]|nr:heme utilization protein [Betaproteobacteria bacterium]
AIGVLSTAQVNVLSTAQVAALSTAQAAVLTTAAVGTLSTAQIQALETADLAALAAYTTAGVGAWSTAQVAVLSTGQIVALTTAQAAVLTTAQAAVLTTAQVVALETLDIAAMTTASIGALTTANVAVLTTGQVAALTTAQLMAFGTAQIQALSPTQAHALTSTATYTWSTASVSALTTTADSGVLSAGVIAALTTADIASFTSITPMVLDLNGDGIKTVGVSSGVQFDLAASGQKLQAGWVAGGDGLLVLDRNKDGAINDGSELFGSATVLPNGQKAEDGYAALRAMDSNGDGVITSDDAGFADLKIWVDGNTDGSSNSGELKSLAELGITKLNLNANASTATDNGNLIGLVSSYETSDGVTHQMADVWFATQPADLTAKVTGLTQAIAEFIDNPDTGAVGTTLNLAAGDTPVIQSLAISTNVGGIVDALKQFDANGNLLASAAGSSGDLQSVTADATLNLAGTTDPTKTGLLASTTATGKS